ncbi:Acetamidase [Dactylellina cionopaga]|nr:Acetamidase [Dactylellina cionopaga]
MRLSVISSVLLLGFVTQVKPETPKWQKIAAERQQHRDSSISRVSPQIFGFDTKNLPLNVLNTARSMLTKKEIEITEKGSMELLELLASGKLTAVEVTSAFLKRAAAAQKLVNCITELLPERALERARFLDEYYEKHKKPIGPFHGLPVSAKEHVGMKGLDLNGGFCSNVGNIAPFDNDLVRILTEAGAVFHARTTEPQTLMQLETRTNIYGTTVNPFNRNLTSGGSSGGEGALMGIRGSSLGIGSDIGGSIRSPSANNGLYGLKPTANRIPVSIIAATGGAEGVSGTLGPISTTLEPLSLFMSTILAAKPWLNSTSLYPIPWRQEPNFPVDESTGKPRKIRIGVMRWDGVVMPHPPVNRALNEVVTKLQEHNDQFEIVEWKEEGAAKAWETISALYFADGGIQEYAEMDKTGEPVLPLSKWILTQPNVPAPPGFSIQGLWNYTDAASAYKRAYSTKWLAAGIDVLLCPVGPGVAPRLETAKYWGYTSMFNLLDYAAAVFPVSQVNEEDNGTWDYIPIGDKDKENAMLWDADYYKDAPVSLQLVGRRFEDEKVLEALSIIHKTLSLPFIDSTKN